MNNPGRIILAVLLAAGIIFPFTVDGYTVYTINRILALAIAIAGVNLLTGVAGMFSIGQSAFFALGAYAIGISGEQMGLNPYLALPLAAFSGGLLGFVFGWPAARLGAVHLALLTWGLAVSMPRLLKSSLFDDWTGGVQGIYLERPEAPQWSGLSDDQWWWFITMALLLLVFWMLNNLIQGRMGRAWRAAKDQPLAAQTMGIHLSYFRAMAFAISGAVTAVAGAITGLLDDFVGPDAYSVFFSITLLVAAVAGGINSLRGAVIGTIVLALLKGVSDNLTQWVAFPIYGFVLIGLMMLTPQGVVPALDRMTERLGRSTKGDR